MTSIQDEKIMFGKNLTTWPLLMMYAIAGRALADPGITSVTITTGSQPTVTIVGSGFGTRKSITPIIWDDFESGTAGSSIGGAWSLDSSAGGKTPEYSSAFAYRGSKSGFANFHTGYNSTSEYKGTTDLTEFYLSYSVYNRATSGAPSRNVKFARVTTGTIDGVYSQPFVGYTQFDAQSTGVFYAYNPGSFIYDNPQNAEKDQIWTEPVMKQNRWQRVEYRSKFNTAANFNGYVGFWVDNVPVYVNNAARLSDGTNTRGFKWLTLPYYVAHDPGGEYEIYYDDVYFDNTPARVEIGNSAEWSSCTQRVIQELVEWSATRIVFNIDASKFGTSGNHWVYVIDPQGAVNQTGIPLGAGTSPAPPSDLAAR
jgi:hypothetical protein